MSKKTAPTMNRLRQYLAGMMTLDEVAVATGIRKERLSHLRTGAAPPRAEELVLLQRWINGDRQVSMTLEEVQRPFRKRVMDRMTQDLEAAGTPSANVRARELRGRRTAAPAAPADPAGRGDSRP